MLLAAVLSLALTCVTFLLFHFHVYSKNKNEEGEKINVVKQLVFQRTWGFVLFGILPAVSIWVATGHSPVYFGAGAENFTDTLIWTAIFAAIVIPMVYLNSIYFKDAEEYGHFTSKDFNRDFLVNSAWSWTAYLLGYELLFRGFLLFSTAEVMPVELAIALNVVIYALVHLPKGAKQTFGALPFGLVLCIVTLHTGTIWVAFFTHVIMALTNDFALYRKSKKRLQVTVNR